ncbi:Type II transport protein GspH [Halomonas sp. THAF12]|uniref:GspH/FimT family pseudopilin n=1 Tax=Halomonas sp. THAF12 TaxID=2587849 RepID=UPI0012693D65|nr:GspH/FimT family pseudopilin [Halomonas sp. THAF12]QFT86391.1 Type II transport protein GspH [Halomonas sp. THAF12]
MGQRGFTLIELLVAMAVAITLATVAVPNFMDMINRQRFATEFNSVLTGLNLARSEAIKRRETVSYVITEPGDTADGTRWQWEVQDASGGVIRQASGGGNIDLSLEGPTSLAFTSLGRIDGGDCDPDACRIALNGEGKPRYYGIEISAYGRIARLNEAPEEEGGA